MNQNPIQLKFTWYGETKEESQSVQCRVDFTEFFPEGGKRKWRHHFRFGTLKAELKPSQTPEDFVNRAVRSIVKDITDYLTYYRNRKHEFK